MKKLTKKERSKAIEKLERQLYKIVDRIYDLNVEGRRIHPVYPYLLCRVLPKEHRTAGGLFLPETDQNKPVYEYIVITTWRSWDEVRQTRCEHYDVCGCGVSKEHHTHNEGHSYMPQYQIDEIVIHHESNFKPGDRIAAPHYEGVPMHGYLDDKYYRLVREIADQKNMPYCGVLGKIDFDGDAEISQQISRLSAKMWSVTTSGLSLSRGDTPPVINTPA